ncbi:MAG TPA: phosphoribosyl-AMP cyclohydrolase [Victivallales bacterium]|nr:phosphoribosyl-AMP cyclohydrolase [Victivallales bacterium]
MNEPDFKKSELIPAIAQDFSSNEILMLAYMNKEAWDLTVKTGVATYWSRSRNKLWKKGESSGNVQKVKEIFLDCDNDTILIKVEQIGGAACHEGYKSCFFRKYKNGKLEVCAKKIFDPDKVYKK